MKNHNLVETSPPENILVEHRPVHARDGSAVAGLHNVWITLNNPDELNSYTTEMIKEIILALREASNDRAAVAVVLTGAGNRSFCAGETLVNMPKSMRVRPGNTANTCGCSTTW